VDPEIPGLRPASSNRPVIPTTDVFGSEVIVGRVLRFSKQHKYTTKSHGLGMGLALCRSIIAAHGGRLWATANIDRGATFRFTLPTGSERVP
jgi:signal transduction histidine kinase